jgi:protein transport protein SEC24
MLVVSDVDDVFLPKPSDLLLNLAECRAGIEALLGRLNEMFTENHVVGSALGPALQAGSKLMVRTYFSYTSNNFTNRTAPAGAYWR